MKKISFLSFRFGAALISFCLSAGQVRAAALATDNASDAAYDSGWANGSNGGSGFAAWVLTGAANAGFFTGDSAGNAGGGTGNINTNPGNRAWGEFANTGDTASAVRQFTLGGSNSSVDLAIGQQFKLSLDNGYINTGGTVGFGLQDSTGTNRFEFFFVSGASNYTVSGAVDQATVHGFTGDGLSTTFTLTGVDTFSFDVTYNTGTPLTENFTGTLKGTLGTGIDRFRTFNANAGTTGDRDAFFNSAQVVPEPSSIALIGSTVMGSLVLLRRRKHRA